MSNDLETCPYDPSHEVRRGHAFQRHLIKCRSNNPEAAIDICKFNSTHHVQRAKLRQHERNCPDAETFEAGNAVGVQGFQEPISTASQATDEDDWDNDEGKKENESKADDGFRAPRMPRDVSNEIVRDVRHRMEPAKRVFVTSEGNRGFMPTAGRGETRRK